MNLENKVHVALVHDPVVDKNGQEITAAITNLDVHDLARLAKTYGLGKIYIVTPDEKQRAMVNAIVKHWIEGFGATYNKDRKAALELVRIEKSIEDVKRELHRKSGRRPLLVSTTARRTAQMVSFGDMQRIIREEDHDFVLLLGTAWGLSEKVLERSDWMLEPIDMNKGYNHLSVRSAASIILDRLMN